MRKVTIAIVLLLILAAPALLLSSQAAILLVVDWALSSFTELRLELSNPSIDLYAGAVTADEVHLIPKGVDGPPLLSILEFSGSTSIADLLLQDLENTHLQARDLVIYVSENDDKADPAPGRWLKHLSWLPKSLRIDGMHMITSAETTLILPIQNIVGERRENASYVMTAAALYDGEPLHVDTTIFAVTESRKFTGLDLKTVFTTLDDDDRIELTGELRGSIDKFSYDFLLDAKYAEVKALLDGFDLAPDIMGALQVSGRIQGDTDAFELSDARFILNNMPHYGIEAAGSFSHRFGGDNELQLIAAGEMDSTGYLLDWLDLDFAQFGRVQASLSVTGSLDEPSVDEFVLTTSRADGLAVKLSGNLALAPLTDSNPDRANKVLIDLAGPSLTVLERWLPFPNMDPGAWNMSATLTGNSDAVNINNLIVEIGGESDLLLRATGRVAKVSNLKALSLSDVQGIELIVTAQADNLVKLSSILEMELPPHLALTGRLVASGDGSNIAINDGTLQLSGSDLEASLDGISAKLAVGSDKPLSNFRAMALAELSDTSALSQYTDKEILVLGAARATASILQRGDSFIAEDIQGQITGEKALFKTSGQIASLFPFSGLSLTNEFHSIGTREVLTGLLPSFSHSKSLGQLSGSFQLADTDGQWHIRELRISNQANPLLQFNIKGDINNVTGLRSGNVDANLVIKDIALLESLTNLRMRAVESQLSVTSTPEALQLTSTSSIGDTLLNADATIVQNGNAIEKLTFKLVAPRLNLVDLGLQADDNSGDGYNPSEQLDNDSPSNDLLALFRTLPDYPIDITVDINGISGINTDIESLDAKLTGSTGRFTLRKLTVDYDNALGELVGVVDLNESPAAVSLAGRAVALPMTNLTRDLGIDIDIEGTLSFLGGLTARGNSLTELATTVDGSMALAMDNGIIEGAAYDVLATDFLAWMYSGAALSNSTYIDCALIAFDLNQSVATSRTLFVESQNMVATGTAKVDFVRNKIDLTFTPRSKLRLLQVPASVSLKGDLFKPRITTSPVAAAADAYAEAISIIPKLTFKIFGIKRNSKEKVNPCDTLSN